jgi:hypothetical protein
MCGDVGGFSAFFVYIGRLFCYIYEGPFLYIRKRFQIYRKRESYIYRNVLRYIYIYIYPRIYPPPGGNCFVYIGKSLLGRGADALRASGRAASPAAPPAAGAEIGPPCLRTEQKNDGGCAAAHPPRVTCLLFASLWPLSGLFCEKGKKDKS